MIKKEDLEALFHLALSNGGDFAEVFEEEKTTNAYEMLNGVVENSAKKKIQGVSIRIYQGLHSVYAYTNHIDFTKLKDMVLTLCDSLKQKENHDHLIQWKIIQYENKHPIQCDPAHFDYEEKIKLLTRANDAAFAYDPCIQKVIASMADEHQDVIISNSDGRYVKDTRVRVRMRVSAIAEDGNKTQDGTCAPGASKGMEFFDETTPESIGKEAARIAKVMLHAQECPSKVMDVVIDHGFGGVIFHEACGHALEAAAVAKHQSVFADRLGEKIANEAVTAIDDGTIPNAWGSANIDDEGNFTRRNVLIEKGILKSYMIDTLSARRMHLSSTGSSRRESYRYESVSRMTNTYLACGPYKLEELISATPYGLYAKTMGGGSVDPSTGDFNFAVLEGYLIENGKITVPVKGATLIGNGAKTLLDIDMVADNLKRAQGMCGASSGSIPTDVGQPAIRVRNMIVGGSKDGDDHA